MTPRTRSRATATTIAVAVAFVLAIVGVASVARASDVPTLLLYGGRNHDTFIGCLNCSRYDKASVCNPYGDFGSRYAKLSIWNPYGEYGSRYNANSPWNRYSTTPPIIVDKDGNSYGYFTASAFHPNRTRIKALVALLDASDEADLDDLRDALCGE